MQKESDCWLKNQVLYGAKGISWKNYQKTNFVTHDDVYKVTYQRHTFSKRN